MLVDKMSCRTNDNFPNGIGQKNVDQLFQKMLTISRSFWLFSTPGACTIKLFAVII
jgi:hypothetical protein